MKSILLSLAVVASAGISQVDARFDADGCDQNAGLQWCRTVQKCIPGECPEFMLSPGDGNENRCAAQEDLFWCKSSKSCVRGKDASCADKLVPIAPLEVPGSGASAVAVTSGLGLMMAGIVALF